MKQLAAISDNEFDGADVDTVIENLDNELAEILKYADVSIKAALDHINERLLNDEDESKSSTISSSEPSNKSSSVKSVQTQSNKSKHSDSRKQQQQVDEANERLRSLEEEQHELEEELQRKNYNGSNAYELNRQRIEDARSIVLLNETRLKESKVREKTAVARKPKLPTIKNLHGNTSHQLPEYLSSPKPTNVKLKGVVLPTFSGEDKSEYEAWKPAFTSVVDDSVMPVKEKMLRLLGCLSGKARETVKDLGFTSSAYERAKEKLERKYGGRRRQTLTQLSTLRALPKVKRHNLEDLENLLTILDRILVALRDDDPDGELRSQHLSLAVKEKLPEDYVRDYKYWLLEQTKRDCFETLVEWLETRVQIMEEAREETGDFQKRSDQKQDCRKHQRGFNTSGKVRTCIVSKCKVDHPPWVCGHFKELPVSERKQLIARSGRCFRCLAIGHHSRNCTRNRECGVDGCKNTSHSSYLHESVSLSLSRDQDRPADTSNNRSSSIPELTKEVTPRHAVSQNNSDETPAMQQNRTNTNTSSSSESSQTERISLMILPAFIENGSRQLKVNVMLDPCSTGTYVTEGAAEELCLQGDMQNLTISGTAGTEVKTDSRRGMFTVTSTNQQFSSTFEANVLDNITGNTPAIQWNDLKRNWSHLKSIPFENVANRRQVDVLIGSDHPIFHQVLREVPGEQGNEPIARLTKLGWVCFGPTEVSKLQKKSRSHVSVRTYCTDSTAVETNNLIRKFWELEAIGIQDNGDQAWTADERAAVSKVEKTQVMTEQIRSRHAVESKRTEI